MQRNSTLTRLIAMNKIGNTPTIPAYSYFGKQCSPGQMNYKVGNKWRKCRSSGYGKRKSTKNITDKHIKNMAKKMKVKLSSRGKRKNIARLDSDVHKKGKSILKSKKDTTLKKYVISHTKSMAKKMKVRFYKRSHLSVWNEVWKKIKKCHSTSKVTKKRNTINRSKGSKKIKPKRRTSKKSKFGSWWDNTQQLYGGAVGKQAADASNLGGEYPFYSGNDNWVPYYSIGGNSFGQDNVMLEYPPNYGIPGIAPNVYIPEFNKYSEGVNIPSSPKWPTYSNIGRFPKSLNSPYPFTYKRKKFY
jgi:hypothetical protein